MGKTLSEIAQELKNPDTRKPNKQKPKASNKQNPKNSSKKIQLIYAFNGTGKTRLSCKFKDLFVTKKDELEDVADEDIEVTKNKILYYNSFTEDLFYWDNDLQNYAEAKLKIQPNNFIKWIIEDQGQDQNIIANFQNYTKKNTMPVIDLINNQITFDLVSGDNELKKNIKISKGEESNFIWSVFYSLISQVIDELNIPELEDRSTQDFNELEYIFIDDPVSSLDENHLIELAVDVAQLIKNSTSQIKFIITTHNPLFFNVLYNECKNAKKYFLKRHEDNTYILDEQSNDSPFSYHLYLKDEVEKAIESGQLKKYHFNFLRNILEKTSTFLGYKNWSDLLPRGTDGTPDAYVARILNISSHSKHSGEEIAELTDDDKRVLGFVVKHINTNYFLNITEE